MEVDRLLDLLGQGQIAHGSGSKCAGTNVCCIPPTQQRAEEAAAEHGKATGKAKGKAE